jgi:DNA-binding SARP family transcriptional activator
MDTIYPVVGTTERQNEHIQDSDVLTIRAFGPPVLHLGSDPLLFIRRKSAALLIYLAVTRRIHARTALADLLWGNLPQERAVANLRKSLTELRERVDEAVLVTHHTVAVNPDYPIMLDVATFEATIERGTATASAQLLTNAVQGYTDDFLAGFSLPTADGFDEWSLMFREHLRDRLITAIESLATMYVGRGAYRAALEPARRVVALDPWREEAHRRLMWLLIRIGDRAAAIAQYEACRRTLEEDLGVEPMAETVALYQQLLAGEKLPDDGSCAGTPSWNADDDNHARVRARQNVTGRVRTYAYRRGARRCPMLSLRSHSSAGMLLCSACSGR